MHDVPRRPRTRLGASAAFQGHPAQSSGILASVGAADRAADDPHTTPPALGQTTIVAASDRLVYARINPDPETT